MGCLMNLRLWKQTRLLREIVINNGVAKTIGSLLQGRYQICRGFLLCASIGQPDVAFAQMQVSRGIGPILKAREYLTIITLRKHRRRRCSSADIAFTNQEKLGLGINGITADKITQIVGAVDVWYLRRDRIRNVNEFCIPVRRRVARAV